MSNAAPNLQTRFVNAVADAFANLPIETNVCPSVRISVRSHRTARLPLDGFLSYFVIWWMILKSFKNIQTWLNSDKNNRNFT